MRKKVLVTMLCSSIILGVCGCGNTINTENDNSNTNVSETTKTKIPLIEELKLEETTLSELINLISARNLSYVIDEGMQTTIADDFLGYDCYYSFEIYGSENNSYLGDDYYAVILFKDDNEFLEGYTIIENYFTNKVINGEEVKRDIVIDEEHVVDQYVIGNKLYSYISHEYMSRDEFINSTGMKIPEGYSNNMIYLCITNYNYAK